MINLTAKLDNDEFQRRLREMRDSARGTTNSIVKDAQRIDTAWQGVASSLKGSEGFGAKLLQGLKPIVPQVEAIRNGVKGIRVDFERFPTITSLQSLPETTTSAARGFNALNFATQQLVREVPAATMGLHMFFLAISNNLPYFADAIKQVREENKALAASGKPTTSVFKQIIGSLFSWQTALIAGITALTLYGKEIGNWVKGLFKSKEALDAVARAEKTLADVRRQGMLDAQEEVTQVKLAVKAMQDSNRSLDERKRAVRTLQDQYPEYFGKLKEEQMLYGEVGDSVDVLIQKMVALATARKSFDKLVENEEKLALLKDTKGYAEWEKANEAFEGVGRKYKFKQQVGGRASDYVWKDTREGMIFDKAQDAFLENLEEGSEETEALFKEISDKYDGNINAYIEAIKKSNEKLTEEASALITTPDLSEDKAAAEEQKRKAQAILAEAEREADERKRAIQRLNNDLSKEVQRTQREMDDAEIATIKDGIERKRREIQAGYERRADEIDKYEADIKAAQGGELTPEQKGHISYLRKANTDTLMAAKVLIKAMQDEAAQEATDAMNEYLASYGTFQERLVAVTAKYSRAIAEAETEGLRMALEAKRDAILAEYEVQASDWAKELVDKTTEQLNAMLEELQAQVDAKQAAFDALDNSGSNDAKKYREEINKLKAQIAELKKELNSAGRQIDRGELEEAAQVFQNISKAADELYSSLEGLDDGAKKIVQSISQMAQAVGDLTNAVQNLNRASENGASTANIATGVLGILLSIKNVLSKVIYTIVSEFDKTELNDSKRLLMLLNEELERMRQLSQIDSIEGTIFGDNAFGNFLNNIEQMRAAAIDYQKAVDEIVSGIKGKNVTVNSWGTSGLTEHISALEGAIEGYSNLSAAIADMNVLVQKGGLFRKEKWQKLGDLLPNIFGETGEVTLEGLKKLKESDIWEKLSQQNRDLIDELIADWDRYEQAMDSVNDYLKDIFGEMGNDITDALVDAFENGTSAAEAMGDAFTDVVNKMARDMTNAAFIQPLLEEAEKSIEALNDRRGEMSAEEYTNELITIAANLVDGALAQEEAANTFLRAIDERMAALGYEGTFDGEASGQSATSKGFAAMSQDTGDELNGRFTDIQGQVHGIREAVEFMKNVNIQHLRQSESISETVAMIHNDTSLIASHTRVLGQMGADIASIKQSIKNGGI